MGTEWKEFLDRESDWYALEQNSEDENRVWESFVAHQLIQICACSGLRPKEWSLLKWKDVKDYPNPYSIDEDDKWAIEMKIHPSTKTGAREVNAMGGEFARRVYEKSPHRKKDDCLLCHLDGSEFTTKQFRTWVYRMTIFTDENKRWGKPFQPYGLRHYYATTRLQNGTSQYALCKNMGVTEPYLRKHYSKYLNRLATKELMKFSKEVGLGGRIIPKGQDFLIDEI